jgi:hypothetical protein
MFGNSLRRSELKSALLKTLGNSNPWQAFDNPEEEKRFQLQFLNSGRRAVRFLMVLLVFWVLERIINGYKDITLLVAYSLWGDGIQLSFHIIRAAVSCYNSKHLRRKNIFTAMGVISMLVSFTSTFISTEKKTDCWLVPAIILEMLALQHVGLIFAEVAMALSFVLAAMILLAVLFTKTSMLVMASGRHNERGCFTSGITSMAMHILFLCCIFTMTSYDKETNARKEFILKKKLRQERIQFQMAADPFTPGNLSSWFKQQFSRVTNKHSSTDKMRRSSISSRVSESLSDEDRYLAPPPSHSLLPPPCPLPPPFSSSCPSLLPLLLFVPFSSSSPSPPLTVIGKCSASQLARGCLQRVR